MHDFSSTYASLAKENPIDVLRLIRSENVGPVTFFKLVDYFGTAAKALDTIPGMAAKGGGKRPLKVADKAQAEKELETAQGFGAQIILYGSSHYPKMLHAIHDPPPLIMALGNPAIWNRKLNIAIVGARNASANACRFAGKLALDLGAEGITVVSGLARGIDGAAHQGSLPSGTVGVIAGGIDTVYPPEHENLYAKMREEGAIICEQPFGTAPQPRNFPARNRIISGMSQGVVVVEASLKSGSLITAEMAAEQNRDVFAVPGSPLDPRCKGTNQLIREGATLTESMEDILNALRNRPHLPLSEPKPADFQVPAASVPNESDLAKARGLVTEKLSADPVLVDELITQCQLTAGVVLTVLLEMELAGRISRHPGNRVSFLF